MKHLKLKVADGWLVIVVLLEATCIDNLFIGEAKIYQAKMYIPFRNRININFLSVKTKL